MHLRGLRVPQRPLYRLLCLGDYAKIHAEESCWLPSFGSCHTESMGISGRLLRALRLAFESWIPGTSCSACACISLVTKEWFWPVMRAAI